MTVVGIVCEYNPLHNGHLAQIEYAKNKLHADAIIVAMSPDFTQRGEAALFDANFRAKVALNAGIDMVVQIPISCATSSAEGYAQAGVSLLGSLGVVTHLLFSAESDNMSMFDEISDILISEPKEYRDVLKATLEMGRSYPLARKEAILKIVSKNSEKDLDEYINFINTPNNILGIEYIKAIKQGKYNMKPVCMKRIGSAYHELSIRSPFASASAIRSCFIRETREYKKAVSKKCYSTYRSAQKTNEFVLCDDLSLILQNKLLSQDDYTEYMDVNEEISNKISKHKYDFVYITQFADLLKSKNYTYTRIMRALTHIMLGITKDMGTVEYIHILGFTLNGAKLMNDIKNKASLPYFTAVKEIEKDASPQILRELKADIYASDIYRSVLTNKTGKIYQNLYTRKFEITE